jgi:hypothetical protein
METFGNWMQEGVSSMGARFGAMVGNIGGQANQAAKGATDVTSNLAKGAADVARETATTVTKLPSTGFIQGRERCTLAPNGAPDCRVAADLLCQAKGYGSGTIVNYETSEKCPPRYRTSSRSETDGVCTVEHFVTRAMCQ